MCGIVGIISSRQEHRTDVVAMRDSLVHRGPDDAGMWLSPDGLATFGHRRLAIIDLSPGGHQPMQSDDGSVSITFNGEIYNYQELRSDLRGLGHSFRSASDTEVILASYRQWGIDCVQYFNGMFAFGLYDSGRRRLLLARDRAGEKPLFYSHKAGTLRFGSELKALMTDPAFPRELDPEAFDSYLAYGYVPKEQCILRGVRKLGQGHVLVYDVDNDHCTTHRYWQLPPPPDEAAPVDGLVDELDALLLDAVRRQMTADVPVGILLSGGIDSSLITAMAARSGGSAVKTFTVTFPGHGVYNEGPHARLVADHFGTDHTELVAELPSVDLLPVLARQYDEPIADSSIVPSYLVSQLIRRHATVALGGDGGDELFGGYPHYSWVQWQERVRAWLPAVLRRGAAELAGSSVPVGVRGRNYVIGLTDGVGQGIAHVNVYFDRWTRRRLLVGGPSRFPEVAESVRSATDASHSLLRQATEADFTTTMCDGYLVKVDRASMLNSLEIRVPFLDYRLVEFAFGRVPDALRATSHERKILPRRLARKLLPPQLDLDRKQGFSIPLAAWLTGPWGPYFEETLRSADPTLFNQAIIQELLAGQKRGRSNSARLFCLTMFELWRREYKIALPA
ncbi:MAG: asparagine synthase (glutamine-hydrolyzing) [Acidobacteriota bacterium]